MLRLLVITPEAKVWQNVAKRLRGVELDTATDAANISNAACDAVAFAGSPSPSADVVKRCLDAKKHVLLATEPELSSDVIRALANAARQAGVQLAIANVDRYLASRQVAKAQIGGPLGAAELVRVHRWEPRGSRDATGSGALPALLVRDLEGVCWLAGQPPRRVYAVESSLPDAGRHIVVHLELATGMALVAYDSRLHPGQGYRSMHVIGTSGAAYSDDHDNVQLLYRGGAPTSVVTGEGIKHLTAMTQEFVDAVREQRDLSDSVTAWLAALELASAVERSLETRQAVALEGA